MQSNYARIGSNADAIDWSLVGHFDPSHGRPWSSHSLRRSIPRFAVTRRGSRVTPGGGAFLASRFRAPLGTSPPFGRTRPPRGLKLSLAQTAPTASTERPAETRPRAPALALWTLASAPSPTACAGLGLPPADSSRAQRASAQRGMLRRRECLDRRPPRGNAARSRRDPAQSLARTYSSRPLPLQGSPPPEHAACHSQ